MDITNVPSPAVRLPGWKIGSAKLYIEQGYSDKSVSTFSHLSKEQVVALRTEMELAKLMDMNPSL